MWVTDQYFVVLEGCESQTEAGKGHLTFSPLGPESPLSPGSPGGPCRRRWRGQVGLPIPPSTTARGASREVTHHGARGAIGAWGSRETLFTLKHRQP